MHEKCRFLELEKPHLFHRHGCLDLQEIQLRNDTNAEAKDAQKSSDRRSLHYKSETQKTYQQGMHKMLLAETLGRQSSAQLCSSEGCTMIVH